MSKGQRLVTLLATGALALATASISANAASVATEAFIANVRPNIDFLDRSSRMALDHGASSRIRTFARSEAIEQTITANSLVAWTQANTTRGAIAAVALPGTVVAAPVVVESVDVATAPVAVAADVVTGRSVALDVPVAINTAPEARRELLPAGQNDLDRLAGLKGRNFDALYRSTQLDALRQLSTLYASYIQNGDDPQLRAMATAELPKINRRIAAMRRL